MSDPKPPAETPEPPLLKRLSTLRLFTIIVLFLGLAGYAVWKSERFQSLLHGISQARLSEALGVPVDFETVGLRLLPPSVSLVNVRVGNDPALGLPADRPLLTAEEISIAGGRSLVRRRAAAGKDPRAAAAARPAAAARRPVEFAARTERALHEPGRDQGQDRLPADPGRAPRLRRTKDRHRREARGVRRRADGDGSRPVSRRRPGAPGHVPPAAGRADRGGAFPALRARRKARTDGGRPADGGPVRPADGLGRARGLRPPADRAARLRGGLDPGSGADLPFPARIRGQCLRARPRLRPSGRGLSRHGEPARAAGAAAALSPAGCRRDGLGEPRGAGREDRARPIRRRRSPRDLSDRGPRRGTGSHDA